MDSATAGGTGVTTQRVPPRAYHIHTDARHQPLSLADDTRVSRLLPPAARPLPQTFPLWRHTADWACLYNITTACCLYRTPFTTRSRHLYLTTTFSYLPQVSSWLYRAVHVKPGRNAAGRT